MALGALGCERRVEAVLAQRVLVLGTADLPLALGAQEPGVEVELVALQAHSGFVGRQQVVRDRAVGRVAQAAILDHRGVLEDERAFLVLVAGVAEVVEPHRRLELKIGGCVRVMAARAAHFALGHRVVRRQLELRVHLLVAVLAGVDRVCWSGGSSGSRDT